MKVSTLLFGGVVGLMLGCGGGGSLETPATAPEVDPADISEHPFYPHAGHIGVPLDDGRVLFAGGTSWSDGAEIYRPADGTWMKVDAMAQPRMAHAMVRLQDGRVLIAGGQDPNENPNEEAIGLDSAEIFDPSSRKFATVASSKSRFLRAKGALLPDGRVLVVECEFGDYKAEIYEPSQDSWSEAPAPTDCSGSDDFVSVGGGALVGNGGSAYELERFDAKDGTWSKTAPAPRKRSSRLAVLRDGRVLATGRLSATVDEPDAAVYDPRTDSWESTPKIPRDYVTTDNGSFALLEAGDRIWRIGGSSERPPELREQVEVWDTNGNAWSVAKPLTEARNYAVAAALPDGSVLVVGGWGEGKQAPLDSAEILKR